MEENRIKKAEEAVDYAIARENAKQNTKWGGYPHDMEHSPVDWVFILMHEVGELADIVFNRRGIAFYQKALRKVAAVARRALVCHRLSQNDPQGGG